jgi:aminopeptidase N
MRINLTLDVPAKSIDATVTHTIAPYNDGLESFALDAIDMDIRSVQAARHDVPFDYDGRRLTIHFPRPLKRGQEVQVAVSYRATPRLGMYFIAPDDGYPDKPLQVWTQCQDEDARYWLPCNDPPNQKQTTEMIATVPGGWYALSNGRLLEEKTNRNGTRTFHWFQEQPHSTYLITLAAGEFSRIEGSHGKLAVDCFVEPKDVDDGTRTFANTAEMIGVFEDVTAMPFPWAKYSQIVVRDFVFGGMENTSATTMTERILFDAKAARDFNSDDLISHELAHMWFGDLLTCRDWSHGWLNESFATYMELLWRERHRGVDEYREGVIDNTNLYLAERYRRPIVSNVFREPIDIFDRHLYEKGSIVLHMLRGVLGEDAFFRSLQRYCRDNQFKNVVTQDLVDAIEAETGRNLEWFFDQWVYRPGHPEFKVSWSWDDNAKLASVTVKQTQKTDDGTSLFRVPLAIDFRKGRGRPSSFDVEVTEAEHTFVFPLPAKPDLCRFDPYNRVLKELEFEKSDGELRLQLRDDDAIHGRIAAAKALGKHGGPDAIAALETAVMQDRHWSVQSAAAAALGELRTTASRDALLRSLAVRNLKARRGVVAALGAFHGDEEVFAALLPLAARDRSWFVEAEANRSIGKLRLPASLDVIKRNIVRSSFREVVRIGCIDGLVELRDQAGFELLAACATYGAPAAARPPAVGALAGLGQRFPERKRPLGEDIAAFLRDPDFRVRIAAANALRTLKAAEQAPALDAMAARELDGRGVRVAREAAAELRKGANTEEEVRALRDEFEKLRDENARLRDRLGRLEVRGQ